MLRLSGTIFGGKAIPFLSLGVVLSNTLSTGVCKTELILSGRQSMFRSFAKPVDCLREILPHAGSVEIHLTHFEFRRAKTALQCLFVPRHRFFGIKGNTPSGGIHKSQVCFRSGVSFRSGFAIPNYGRFIALRP